MMLILGPEVKRMSNYKIPDLASTNANVILQQRLNLK